MDERWSATPMGRFNMKSKFNKISRIAYIANLHRLPEEREGAIRDLEQFLCRKGLGDTHWLLLTTRLNDRNPSVRLAVVESMIKCPLYISEPYLCAALHDPYALVRITALETLGYHHVTDAYSEICKLLRKDQNALVRSYAAAALGQLGLRKAIGLLRSQLKRETRGTVRLGLYSGLYQLGEIDVLDAILGILDTDDYRARCAVVNELMCIAKPVHRRQIHAAFQRRLERESTVAVEDTLRRAIRHIGLPKRKQRGK